jgi:outer membrane protein insertion porin family
MGAAMKAFILSWFIVLGGAGSALAQQLDATPAQEGTPPKIVVDFEGNKIFSKQELSAITNTCLDRYFKAGSADDSEQIDYCLHKVKVFLYGKGYLNPKLGELRRTRTENGLQIFVPIDEGARYRLGEVKVEGSKLFTPAQILEMIAMKTGDIVNGEKLSEALYERVKKAYARLGYIEYTAEITPHFHLNASGTEGTADFSVTIDEGEQFTIRSIKFDGNGDIPEDALLGAMLVRSGEVFNKELLDESLKRIDQTGQFETIDSEKDVDYRSVGRNPQLDLTIHLKKKADKEILRDPSSSLQTLGFFKDHLGQIVRADLRSSALPKNAY